VPGQCAYPLPFCQQADFPFTIACLRRIRSVRITLLHAALARSPALPSFSQSDRIPQVCDGPHLLFFSSVSFYSPFPCSPPDDPAGIQSFFPAALCQKGLRTLKPAIYSGPTRSRVVPIQQPSGLFLPFLSPDRPLAISSLLHIQHRPVTVVVVSL